MKKPWLKKGDVVLVQLHCAGLVTQETRFVFRSTKKGVWLDNGSGNDPSGPFVNRILANDFGKQVIVAKAIWSN